MKKILAILCGCLMFAKVPINTVASDLDTYIDKEIQDACVKVGEEYGLCAELLMAIIEHESSGRQYAENGDCKGLTQINQYHHAERMEKLGVTDIYDIEGNIRLCADYIMYLADKYQDIYLVLMCYNMGEGRAKELYSLDIYSDYAISVAERSAEIEKARGY